MCTVQGSRRSSTAGTFKQRGKGSWIKAHFHGWCYGDTVLHGRQTGTTKLSAIATIALARVNREGVLINKRRCSSYKPMSERLGLKWSSWTLEFPPVKDSRQCSFPQKVLQLLNDRISQTICDTVIITDFYSFWIKPCIYFVVGWGSDSSYLLLVWSEILKIPHLHVVVLRALCVCDWLSWFSQWGCCGHVTGAWLNGFEAPTILWHLCGSRASNTLNLIKFPSTVHCSTTPPSLFD